MAGAQRGTEAATMEYIRSGIIRAKVAMSGLQDCDGETIDGVSVIYFTDAAIHRLLSRRINRHVAYAALSALDGVMQQEHTRYCPQCQRMLPYLSSAAFTLNYWHRNGERYHSICRQCRCLERNRTYRNKRNGR
jgi:hypothetical protein